MAQIGPSKWKNIFNNKKKDKEEVYEDEIRNILCEGHEQGLIQKEEAEMINKIFEFSDKSAKDIMTVRKKVVAIEKHMPLKDAVNFIMEQNYSRFPLYDEDLDNVIGVLHLKDVMKAYLTSPDIHLSDIAQEAYFVHEAQDISNMFSEMQQKKIHMAIVVDEYGQTAGIVAMEDILEVIVGNILDEHDEEEHEKIRLCANGEYLINGLVRLDQITDELGIEFPDEDVDTLNGFIIYKLGRLPVVGEKIQFAYEGFLFQPLEISDNIITLVKVTPLPKKEMEH